jgi:hypothetical protein
MKDPVYDLLIIQKFAKIKYWYFTNFQQQKNKDDKQ